MTKEDTIDIVLADDNISDPGDPRRKQNAFYTGFNVMKTIVGAGIFATASAFESSGFYFGLVLVVGLGLIFFWSIMTLVNASEKAGTATIQELLYFCFGKFGVLALNVILIFITWGSVAAYSVVIGDVFPDVLRQVMGVPSTPFMDFFLSRRGQVILVSILILFPISSKKSLASLGKFSGFALAGVVFIIVAALAVAPTLGSTYKGDTSSAIPFIRVAGIPSAISTFSFAYVCQQNILLNYNALKRSSVPLFRKITFVVLLATVTLTIMSGINYVFLREKSTANILNAFPLDMPIIVACRILFGIDMLFTYPLECFVLRDTIERSFFSSNTDFSAIRHYSITTLIVASTTIVASLTCDLGMIIDITGGVGASFLAFIIPSACLLRVARIHNQKSNREQDGSGGDGGKPMSLGSQVAHYGILVFGFALIVLTLVQIVLASSSSKEPKQCGF